MQIYTLGFAFDPYGRVALIKKAKPEWQAGRYNGIGGKHDGKELNAECMSREFEEETGVHICHDKWAWVGRIFNGRDSIVHVYTYTGPEVGKVKTTTNEEVILMHAYEVLALRPGVVIENVPLLLMACQLPPSLKDNSVPVVDLRYGDSL